MAQSLNKAVEFHTTGVSYLGVGERLEKSQLGMPLLNFMRMLMLKTTSKFPGKKSTKSEPMYPDVKLAAILKSIPENQNFSLLQKTLEKF